MRLRNVVGAVALTFLSGCDGNRSHGFASVLTAAGEHVGITDARPEAPEAIFLLCDASAGSRCDETQVGAMVVRIATMAFARPGSEVHLFLQGRMAAETEEVASIEVPARTERSPREMRAAEQRFQDMARLALCPPIRNRLQGTPARRSPIAESLAKMALVNTHGLPRRIVLLSDGREVALADFECRPPTTAQWFALLDRAHVLAPGSLSHTVIHIALVSGAPVPHRECEVSVGRELHLRSLWTEALHRAGASVTFDTGLPDLERYAHEASTPTPPMAMTHPMSAPSLPQIRRSR